MVNGRARALFGPQVEYLAGVVFPFQPADDHTGTACGKYCLPMALQENGALFGACMRRGGQMPVFVE
jgi:hypothetical protein